MDEPKHKYRAICDEIRKEIEARRFDLGQRLPSDSELAQRFSTSRLTVIRALRELEASGIVRRRAGSGTYVSGTGAVTSRAFGILMPDMGDGEVFEPISQGIAFAAEAAHQGILWGNVSTPDVPKEGYAVELCRYFISRRVAGVFFAPVELSANAAAVNARIIADLEAAGIRIVLVDRCIRPYPDRSRYDLVGIDNYRAGFRMTQHLLNSGVTRIAFAYRSGSAPTVAARMAGFREAMRQASLPSSDALTLDSDGSDPEALRRLIQRSRVNGLVCANDLTAAKLMHSLLSLGIRVPEDVRMVGVNDVKYARFLPVPLTTLRQPCKEIGFAAMTAMLQRIEKDDSPARDILLDCELVIRNSCGASGAQKSLAAAKP